MKKPKKLCRGTASESKICQTAAELSALFNKKTLDAPDALMADYPNFKNITEALQVLIDLMFPGKLSDAPIHADELSVFLLRRLGDAWRLLRMEILRALPFRWMGEAARMEGVQVPQKQNFNSITDRILCKFMDALPCVRKLLVEDIRAAYEGDPAALTYAEVLLAYPGLMAIASHRIAHELYELDVPIIPRVMSEWTHSQTGVDIHPGAKIGHGFFMDHATGIVIGETAIIGDHVKIYQGVTLGARSFAMDKQGHPIKHIKRHPTVEDHVVIYANAAILGGETVIGKGSIIGANVFLSESVAIGSIVTSKHPELNIRDKNGRG